MRFSVEIQINISRELKYCLTIRAIEKRLIVRKYLEILEIEIDAFNEFFLRRAEVRRIIFNF